jgi:hypothetical protein
MDTAKTLKPITTIESSLVVDQCEKSTMKTTNLRIKALQRYIDKEDLIVRNMIVVSDRITRVTNLIGTMLQRLIELCTTVIEQDTKVLERHRLLHAIIYHVAARKTTVVTRYMCQSIVCTNNIEKIVRGPGGMPLVVNGRPITTPTMEPCVRCAQEGVPSYEIKVPMKSYSTMIDIDRVCRDESICKCVEHNATPSTAHECLCMIQELVNGQLLDVVSIVAQEKRKTTALSTETLSESIVNWHWSRLFDCVPKITKMMLACESILSRIRSVATSDTQLAAHSTVLDTRLKSMLQKNKRNKRKREISVTRTDTVNVLPQTYTLDSANRPTFFETDEHYYCLYTACGDPVCVSMNVIDKKDPVLRTLRHMWPSRCTIHRTAALASIEYRRYNKTFDSNDRFGRYRYTLLSKHEYDASVRRYAASTVYDHMSVPTKDHQYQKRFFGDVDGRTLFDTGSTTPNFEK